MSLGEVVNVTVGWRVGDGDSGVIDGLSVGEDVMRVVGRRVGLIVGRLVGFFFGFLVGFFACSAIA